MLSARYFPEDRARGYVNGADICLSKPADLGELRGAVSALRRRLRPTAPETAFRLNPHRLRLTSPDGQSVSLLPREADLLVAFCRAPSSRLEQSIMIDLLNKDAADHPKSALELHVLRIRKKIMQLGDVGPGIQSIRGWGYQLCMNVIIE
jgi:DNA-binding response OmpR family regulator